MLELENRIKLYIYINHMALLTGTKFIKQPDEKGFFLGRRK